MAFLKFLSGIGIFLVYAIGMIVAALIATVILAVFVVVRAPDLLIEIVMVGVITPLAIILLGVAGWVRFRVGLWFYLKSLPRQEAHVFHQAFPEYEESFLLEVRQVIAAYLKIETERVAVQLNLADSSPLEGKQYELYEALFTRFRPAASPEWEMWSLKFVRIHPIPEYVVEFPTQHVRMMSDLLREVDELRKGKVAPFKRDEADD